MPKPLQSTPPHHLIHALYTQKTVQIHTAFPIFSDTPHIHLTIIRSILPRLCRFAFFTAQVSVPYVNALWTQALYIFPFMRYDAPQTVRIGDNRLNYEILSPSEWNHKSPLKLVRTISDQCRKESRILPDFVQIDNNEWTLEMVTYSSCQRVISPI